MSRTLRALCALAIAAAAALGVGALGEPTWDSSPAGALVASQGGPSLGEGEPTWDVAPTNSTEA
jgi:hypothetical protein